MMARFSERLGSVQKTRNGAEAAKADIRGRVLAEIPSPAVFDVFAGDGTMHRAVWHRAPRYVGCDLDWWQDDRIAYVADNRRVMRAIDLGAYNIFDLDAYGSPWEQAIILSRRRRVEYGELIGVTITEGSGLKLKFGSCPKALAYLAGVQPDLPGASAVKDDLIDMALAGMAGRMQCEIVRRWQAKGRTGAAMLYVGVVLRGIGEAAPQPPVE